MKVKLTLQQIRFYGLNERNEDIQEKHNDAREIQVHATKQRLTPQD
jgi:hypothetical protein